jgi:Domain of unknown function (DUF6249)
MNEDIVVPIAFFACVAVVGALVLIGYIRHTVQRHQTLRAMVEKGMQIPPELLGQGQRPPSPRRDVRRGILLICFGLGVGLFLIFADGEEGAGMGLIPILVGIGYLIVAALDSRRERQRGSQAIVDEALAR